MNPATLRLLIDRARAGSELAQARHGSLRPVSYTHLTLPTIYSV